MDCSANSDVFEYKLKYKRGNCVYHTTPEEYRELIDQQEQQP